MKQGNTNGEQLLDRSWFCTELKITRSVHKIRCNDRNSNFSYEQATMFLSPLVMWTKFSFSQEKQGFILCSSSTIRSGNWVLCAAKAQGFTGNETKSK